VYFVAVIMKVLLVNLLAALNSANFFKIKNVWKIKKNVKNVKNVTKILKNVKKRFFNIYAPYCRNRARGCIVFSKLQ